LERAFHHWPSTRRRTPRTARPFARYGDLFEALPDAIVIVNDSGRIVHVNAQAVALFGHAPARVIGEPVEVLLPPRLRAQHLPQRSGYLQSPRLRPMGRGLDLLGMRADGAEFPVEISLGPIELEGRRLVISAIRDISDRKNIERALQQQNVELERANRAKDHFLATMSHELRTPLNAILGFTGLMLMRLPGPLTEAQERQLGHVQASGQHLLSLINDLLDLARIESGHVELVCEPVDPRPVLDEVLTALRPTADAKGLPLEASIPDDEDLRVLADRRALHQVVLNLTANAIKFTAGGRVRIELLPRPPGRLALSVVDTGVGISAEDRARLFQAFTQVGDWRTRRGEGTGLGLHLSHKLAELMDATIEVDSEPGRGSRFSLVLRRAA
jgi:protein-histidine pros-kinase